MRQRADGTRRGGRMERYVLGPAGFLTDVVLWVNIKMRLGVLILVPLASSLPREDKLPEGNILREVGSFSRMWLPPNGPRCCHKKLSSKYVDDNRQTYRHLRDHTIFLSCCIKES